MKRNLIFIITAIILCVSLVSCSEDFDVTADIRYSVYENEGKDMVSFYMTSDAERDGKWSYSTDKLECLSVYLETDETEENALFQTLILKAESEGEALLKFSLKNGRYCEYTATVKKDDAGILRITVKENAIVMK